MRKLILGSAVAGIMALTAMAPAFAAKPSMTNLLASNWRVYNIMPATAKLWDINQPKTLSSGALQFPIQKFLTTGTGSFVVYFLNNHNVDITGKTITAAVNWTAATVETPYVTRGLASDGAFVRIEFQDVASGPYNSNDYWWYSGSLDLNAGSSGILTASLADRANWTNLCGQSATDTTVYSGPDCGLGGTYPAVSPSDGFTNAMKNVKQVSLAFGNASRYASGVALVGGTGIFDVTSFTVTP